MHKPQMINNDLGYKSSICGILHVSTTWIPTHSLYMVAYKLCGS